MHVFFGVLLLLHVGVFCMWVCIVGCWCVCGGSFLFPNNTPQSTQALQVLYSSFEGHSYRGRMHGEYSP